jgi:phosphoglycolate phosphatase-like HAD superfamily hydrolase
MKHSIVYALDFDGVICDSAVETGMTGWKAAQTIWQDMPTDIPPEMVAQFRLIRPIIETGYEAILAMRLLYLGNTTEEIYRDYAAKIQAVMQDAQITVDELKQRFGAIRDAWIADDLADWVAMNPLFPTIADKLQSLTHEWYIITTKQERFVKQILQANGIELDDERIFGLDRNKTKPEILTILLQQQPTADIRFVEDRLPTLLNVQKEQALANVQLICALWGYNTADDKAQALQQPFVLQELPDFCCKTFL